MSMAKANTANFRANAIFLVVTGKRSNTKNKTLDATTYAHTDTRVIALSETRESERKFPTWIEAGHPPVHSHTRTPLIPERTFPFLF